MCARIVALMVIGIACARPAAATEVGYASQPALHGERLIFVSEGDLWTARLDAAGDGPIVAHRLTASDGLESHPQIGPEGRWIAFAAEYDGNTDVYVMPIDGGAPTRLTFHPGRDLPVDWSADGRLVHFRSSRQHPHGRDELYAVPRAGGSPRRFAFGECTMISHSATGRRFAFTRWSNETWHWKGYRGGTAPEIWIGDAGAEQFTALTADPANDLFPMWLAGRVFFLSDRSGHFNIWSDRPAGGELRQHTRFAPVPGNPTAIEGYDVRWPSADTARGGKRIAFCQGGGLALLDGQDDAVRRLDVRLASDRVPRRRRFASPDRTALGMALSPDGSALAVATRGEVVHVDVDTGFARQLTRTSGAREHGVRWLDDDQLVLITDENGEAQIATLPANGSGTPALVTNDREDWLFAPVPSDDGKRVAFADKTMRLHDFDMATLERRSVDRAEAGEITDYRYAPDGSWIAYTRPLPNGSTQIMLYAVRTGRTHPVTDGFGRDREPRWDPAGKYLYYLADRHLDPVMDQLDFNHIFVSTTQVYVVPLTNDVPPPMKSMVRGTSFDLDAWGKPASGESDAAAPDPDVEPDPAAAAEPPPPLRIDTEDIMSRAVALPIEPGRYQGLEALPGGVLYVATPVEGLLAERFPPSEGLAPGKGTLHRYDLTAEKDETITTEVDGYVISRDRTTIAWPGKGGVQVKKLAGGEAAKTVDFSGMRLLVDVPAEWAQMLDEAWRLQRDFFWDPDMVGVDWPAMREKYAALLPRVGTRVELNDAIGEMIGELRTSHTYIFGGEKHEREVREPVAVGLLGADLAAQDDGFRIERVLRMPSWAARPPAPLQPAHLGVEAGDVIRAVDGMPIGPGINIHTLLQDRAGKHVRLTVQSAERGKRDFEIVPLPSERELRYLDWVEANRVAIDAASDGVIGYVHVPDMSGRGLAMFSRQFYPQFDKRAFVIDVRDNGGGFVSQMILERLARRVLAFGQPRHGVTERYPWRAPHAHMVCLIDQHAGSDGDIFPSMFRRLELGPLIGTRTWGGVVGIRGDKTFVDLGLSTQPEYAWWDDTGWAIENEGVTPDVEVAVEPADRIAGRDPQRDAGVQYLRDRLAEDDKKLPAPPPYPRR